MAAASAANVCEPPFRTAHWKTTTCVAALTTRGIIAPWVLDGPINRDAFETYVEKVLVPELPQDAIVIMDNLSSHKGPRIREMIEAAGATLLYLPPYSPDLNPIENAFAKLKANLRKAAERTVNGLWDAVGRIVDTYTPQNPQTTSWPQGTCNLIG
ncbi:transposase [Bradyrhizobium sp. F1.4.3]